MNHLTKMLKEFEEKCLMDIILSTGKIEDWKGLEPPTKWHLNKKKLLEWSKYVLITSHLSYLCATRRRLQGTLKEEVAGSLAKLNGLVKYNSAIYTQLSHIDEEIKECEELLK